MCSRKRRKSLKSIFQSDLKKLQDQIQKISLQNRHDQYQLKIKNQKAQNQVKKVSQRPAQSIVIPFCYFLCNHQDKQIIYSVGKKNAIKVKIALQLIGRPTILTTKQYVIFIYLLQSKNSSGVNNFEKNFVDNLRQSKYYPNNQLNHMGLEETLLSQRKIKQMTHAHNPSQYSKKQQVNLNIQQLQSTLQSSQLGKIKFLITLLTIILTSFQCYDITTKKLQHSRNFIRFLNFYLIQHQGFDIYWAGQYMLNYPVQEYQVIEDMNKFLIRFDDIMKNLDDKVYGLMDVEGFLSRKNSIYVQQKQGGVIEHEYVISEGFKEPFQIDNLTSIKQTLLSSQEIQISLQKFALSQHIWNLMISITTFSETSIFVQIHAYEELPIWKQHIPTFVMGLMLLACLVWEYRQNRKHWVQNVPQYLICLLLLNTFFASLNTEIDCKWIVMLDGVQCCAAWILILKFLQKQDDYHISFLLKKSYALVGKLFVSFGPIFIAFAIFGYTLFCREAWQFASFKRTFMTLFYISYYNATYESFVVTMRANPISMIFFFSFVILFTICVYSGMLVSVFCSYVWNKRESKIKQQIVNNLKIQCTQCDHKYKYVDCLKILKDPKRSLKMSFVMQVNFKNVEQRHKYKKTLATKMKFLTQKIDQLMTQSSQQIVNSKSQIVKEFGKNKFFGTIKAKINNMLKEELPEVEKDAYVSKIDYKMEIQEKPKDN